MSTKSEKVDDSKQERKPRPSVQIYRPPGLRGGNVPNNQPMVEPVKLTNSSKPLTRKESDQFSTGSSESQNSIKKVDRPKQKEPTIRIPSKKVIGKEEIIALVQKLNLKNEKSMIDDFIQSMESLEVASRLGHFVARYAIEENRQSQRTCSQLSNLLLDCPAAQSFYGGLVDSLNQYLECADKLRSTHFRVWLNFLNFISDVYAITGYRFEGEIADIIFKVYGYMLNSPVLEELKIEELECLIAILLNLGYDLERDCPGELSTLKNLMRNALVLANESWSRKMLLLLVELSASNFTLSNEANEYYFQ